MSEIATPEIVVTEVTPIVAPSVATAPSEATPVTPPSHDDVRALLAAVVERLERLERLEKAAEVKTVSCSCLPFWSKKAEASAGAGSA